jgi:DNA polymerase III alpha subunit
MTSRRDFLKVSAAAVGLAAYAPLEGVHSIRDLDKIPDRSLAVLSGQIADIQVRSLRNDTAAMAVFHLRDPHCTVECVCFSREYAKYKDLLFLGAMVEIAVAVRRTTPVDEETGESLPGAPEPSAHVIAVQRPC